MFDVDIYKKITNTLNNAFKREEGNQYICLSCCMIVNGTVECPRCCNKMFFTPRDNFQDLVKGLIEVDDEDVVEKNTCTYVNVVFSYELGENKRSLLWYNVVGKDENSYYYNSIRGEIRDFIEFDESIEEQLSGQDKGAYSATVKIIEDNHNIQFHLSGLNKIDFRTYNTIPSKKLSFVIDNDGRPCFEDTEEPKSKELY